MKTLTELKKLIPSGCCITEVTSWDVGLDYFKGKNQWIVFRNVEYFDGEYYGMTSDVDSVYPYDQKEKAYDRLTEINTKVEVKAA